MHQPWERRRLAGKILDSPSPQAAGETPVLPEKIPDAKTEAGPEQFHFID